jgi:hypothetical protein
VSSVPTSVCSLAFEICLFTDAQQDSGNVILHWFRSLKDKFVEGWNNIRLKFVEVWNNIKHKSVELWTDVKKEVMDVCSCIRFDCGCCFHLELKEINLNNTSKIVVVT